MSSKFPDFPTLRRLKTRKPEFAEEVRNHKASTRQKSLILPTGTTFSIYIVRECGKRKQVLVRKCPSRPNSFIALFEENKVDFEIDIDNKDSKNRHLSLDLEINGKMYGFVIPKDSDATMETVENNGRKFHFSSSEAQPHHRSSSMLNLAQKMSTLSRVANYQSNGSSSSSSCLSQITFKVQYSKVVSSSVFEVFVKTPKQKIYSLEVFGGDLTENLVMTVENIRTIGGLRGRRLYFDGKHLQSGLTLTEQGIGEGSVIDVLLPQEHLATCPGGGIIDPAAFDESLSPDHITVLEENFHGDKKNNKSCKSSGFRNGANTEICKGDKSEQQFFSKGFDADDSIRIEPFTIELKRASACSVL